MLHAYFESYLCLGYAMPDIRIHKQNEVNAEITYLDVFSSDTRAGLCITLFWQVNCNDRRGALHLEEYISSKDILVRVTLLLSYG